MMYDHLSGKGKETDIKLLRLLLESGPLTLWEAAKFDGGNQDYHERKKRMGIYRRAISGRKDSRALALLQRGYVITSERKIKGKTSKPVSITEEGVKELLYEDLIKFSEDYAQKLLEQEGIDTIVKVSLKTGTDPISFLKIYLDEKGLDSFAELIKSFDKEYPYTRELDEFTNWLRKAEPELYNEWHGQHIPIRKILKKARPEVIEKIKRNFPLNSARWEL